MKEWHAHIKTCHKALGLSPRESLTFLTHLPRSIRTSLGDQQRSVTCSPWVYLSPLSAWDGPGAVSSQHTWICLANLWSTHVTKRRRHYTSGIRELLPCHLSITPIGSGITWGNKEKKWPVWFFVLFYLPFSQQIEVGKKNQMKRFG